ncbi:MAG: DUF4115 domain-containing protein [Azoarcus sp.]|jgi:cytoskeleton protein RodZ|nr:DUF4115 domain-containing protein [Azoarcus sp.]
MKPDPVTDAAAAGEAGAAALASASGGAPDNAPGSILRKAREARGESRGDVVQALKLSLQQIEAIESGRFEALPGPLFVRGFLRNYARHLGLDPQPLLAGFDGGTTMAAAPGSTLDTRGHAVFNAQDHAPAAVKPRSSLLPLSLVVAVLLALLGAGIFFGWFEAWQEPESTVVTTQISEPGGIAPESSQQPEAAGIAPSPDVPAPSGESPPAADAPRISTLAFTLTAKAWIKVSEEGRSGFLVNRTYAPGSAPLRVQGKPPFSLSITNADKVTLEFDGKPVDLKPYTNKANTASLTLQ